MPGLTFLHPWMLWGLLAASIPIIIHLLNKWRYRPIPWAAMRFLKEAIRVNARRIRIEDLILLVLRCAVLFFAALAFALPVLKAGALLLGAQPHTCMVLLLDDSYSMNYIDGDRTRFEAAREAARDTVGRLRRGDSVSVILMADPPRRLFREPTYDLDLAQSLIDRLECSYSPAATAKALEMARQDVADARQPARTVCLISDYQRDLLAGSSIEFHLEALSKEADLLAVPIGEGYDSNLAVVELESEAGMVAIGVPTVLHARIHNFGQVAQADYPVELYIDGQRRDRRWIDVPPGGEVDVTFLIDFRETGQHAVEVRLSPDTLPTDNARYRIIEVRNKVPILLISGESPAPGEVGATEYVGTALAPGWLLGETAEDHLSPTRLAPTHLRAGELEEFPTIVLIDVATLEPVHLAALRQYVRSGGGLLIVPGERMSASQYNEQLFQDGEGLLPARINMPGIIDEPEPVFLSPEGYDHPVLSLFSDPAYGDLSQTRFQRTVLLDVPTTSRVVCRFNNGRPAIVERSFGKGRVMVLASGLGRDWGNFVWKPAFLVLTRRMAEYLMRRGSEGLNLQVYDELARFIKGGSAAEALIVVNPDGDTGVAEMESAIGGVQVRYAAVDRPGVYRLNGGPELVGRFAANIDPGESDLGLPPMGLADTPLQRVAPDKLDTVAGTAEARSELWMRCLQIALALIVAEVIFLVWIETRDRRSRKLREAGGA